MSISNCAECGRLFQKMSRDICANCIRKEEDLFDEVKKYIRLHGQATMQDICDTLNTTEEKLLKFMKEGRLMASSSMAYPCEGCGKSIQSGRMCETCRGSLQSKISSVGKSMSSSSGTDAKSTSSYHFKRK